jgi:hypothetical protein
MAWLPGVSPRKASDLVGDLGKAAVRETSGDLPPLARANVLASFIETLGSSATQAEAATIIMRLALAVDSVDLDDVVRDINEDRAVAGFTSQSDADALGEEFESRKRGYKASVISFLDRFPTRTVVKIMDTVAGRSTNEGSQPAQALVQDLFEAYELDAKSFVELETENIEKLSALAREVAPTGEAKVLPFIEEIKRIADNFLTVVKPIQVVNKSIGLTHRPSHNLGYEIRSLSVDLYNQYGFIDATAQLTDYLKGRFAAVDDVIEKVSEDDAFLKNAAEQKRQSELDREAFEREITYSAEVGVLFKDSISISPQGVTWKSRSMPLEAITRLRWGATRHSVNGIPTGTDFMIVVGDQNRTININMRNKEVFGHVIERLWRAVGVRLLIQTVARLKDGEAIAFGEAIIRDGAVGLVRHKIFASNERVELPWSDVQIRNYDGNFVIGARNDKKVYASLSYQNIDNVHVLENLIRAFFQKPLNRISQLFE